MNCNTTHYRANSSSVPGDPTVLGNAELALILDPSAIALRAGIAIRGEDEALRAKQPAAGGDDGVRAEFLLVEIAERQAAVALADVVRIEQIPVARVESLGYRQVINFEGELVPVEDTGGLVAAAQSDPGARIIVVICLEGSRHVGIAVSHVLDVASGGALFEAGTHQAAGGVTLLKSRVTGVIDLAGVAPLALAESGPRGWSEYAEATR